MHRWVLLTWPLCPAGQGDVRTGPVHLYHPQQDLNGDGRPAAGRHHAGTRRIQAGQRGRGGGGGAGRLLSSQFFDEAPRRLAWRWNFDGGRGTMAPTGDRPAGTGPRGRGDQGRQTTAESRWPMGLSVRDWMIIVGVLLVLAVLLDGYRRMRQEWRSQLRVSLSRSSPEEREAAEWELVSSELPNGGARVVGRSHRGDQGEGVAARIEPRLSPLDPSATPVEAMESEPADRSEPDSPPPQESDLSPAEPAPAADALVPNDQPSPALSGFGSAGTGRGVFSGGRRGRCPRSASPGRGKWPDGAEIRPGSPAGSGRRGGRHQCRGPGSSLCRRAAGAHLHRLRSALWPARHLPSLRARPCPGRAAVQRGQRGRAGGL